MGLKKNLAQKNQVFSFVTLNPSVPNNLHPPAKLKMIVGRLLFCLANWEYIAPLPNLTPPIHSVSTQGAGASTAKTVP